MGVVSVLLAANDVLGPADVDIARRIGRHGAASASSAGGAPAAPPAWPWHFTAMLMKNWGVLKACHQGVGDFCEVENAHIAALFIFLCVTIVVVLCIYMHLHEDTSEEITPLTPQLLAKGGPKIFRMVLNDDVSAIDVTDDEAKLMCRVVVEWPDPLRPGFGGVAATVRILNDLDYTLTTVVARSVSVQGQGICVCRANSEIFGFVEHVTFDEGQGRPSSYNISHRTSGKLLTVTGSVGPVCDGKVEMTTPAGLTICTIVRTGLLCEGHVHANVDIGLMIISFFAARLNEQLLVKEMPSPWDFATYDPVPPLELVPKSDAVPASPGTGDTPSQVWVRPFARSPDKEAEPEASIPADESHLGARPPIGVRVRTWTWPFGRMLAGTLKTQTRSNTPTSEP
mmetsp:Transcript_8412/g.21538  ORF Transcript_8412/g.21538 Transcript_8412/m.21538 type:complete len:398 (-) Transcript_8412:70-1263(-)